MGRIGTTLCALLLLLSSAAAQESPRITSVTPVREGEWLCCLIRTEGLPGARMLSSMESGLLSSIEIKFDVFDARQRRVSGRQVTIELIYDLWDEVFSVDFGQSAQRLADLEALHCLLRDPPMIRIAPLGDLARGMPPFVLRAGLILNPIASRDRDRVEDVISGSGPGSVDRRESTFDLGHLIRFFYRRDEIESPDAVRSPIFEIGGLADAND